MRAILATPQFPPDGPEYIADRTLRPSLTLEGLVASCLRDASGDPVAAALLLEDRIGDHAAMLAELVQPYLADACWKAVQRRLEAVRKPGTASETAPSCPDTSERLHALADSLLDFRLPSGTLLRDAFRHDVEQAAQWYLGRARSLQRKGKWLAAIAPLVPRAKVVGHVLDGHQLQHLLNSATPD
ncbi:hypothetical protein [Luteimonas sp. SDU82]|uniref:hypothetical protein n=1 Tax=Luteimonas sp. SDU82 TaxID=3422592 RepID=UPI003EBCD7A5